MNNPNTGFVIAAYAVGVLLIAIEIVLVRRRLSRARAQAAQPVIDHES
jgi:predicted MFS family arabinose efflux permease